MAVSKTIAIAIIFPLLLSPSLTSAQETWPSKPLTMIIPYAPGGGVDLECRLYPQRLGANLGQQVVIDYKPGGGTITGIGYVARSRPDGYTFIAVSAGLPVLPVFNKDLPFDVSKDLTPVSLMSRQIAVLLANPAFPPKTLDEYMSYARTNPGKVNYGTSGAGSISHLGGAWLHSLTNTKVTFVAHKGGGPLLVELIAGRVDVGNALIVAGLPMIKAGKARPLAVLGDQRYSQLPSLPTAFEQGVLGYNYPSWIGFLSAANTPAPIVNRLSESLARVVMSPEIVAELDKQGSIPVGGTPEQLRTLLVTEQARWQKLVKETGMKLEE